jgi:hypothetical protein
MRFVPSALAAFRPFGRLWVIAMTFGAGGGTPNSAPWLIAKFSLVGVLLASLLGSTATDVFTGLTRRR